MKLLRLALEESRGWIGFDWDGTLVTYDQWRGIDHSGDPVEEMWLVLKEHLAAGDTVKIFTARMDQPTAEEAEQAINHIQAYCEQQCGRRLDVTNIKDKYMHKLYDDRARQVVQNTGTVLEVE